MKQHQYRVTLEYLADADNNPVDVAPLQFNAPNHDNILAIVDEVNKRGGLSAEDAIALPNLFYGQQGVLIENDAAGKAIADKMAPFGYPFVPTDLGSKLNAAQRVGEVWHGAADPRGPGTSSVDDAPPQS